MDACFWHVSPLVPPNGQQPVQEPRRSRRSRPSSRRDKRERPGPAVPEKSNQRDDMLRFCMLLLALTLSSAFMLTAPPLRAIACSSSSSASSAVTSAPPPPTPPRRSAARASLARAPACALHRLLRFGRATRLRARARVMLQATRLLIAAPFARAPRSGAPRAEEGGAKAQRLQASQEPPVRHLSQAAVVPADPGRAVDDQARGARHHHHHRRRQLSEDAPSAQVAPASRTIPVHRRRGAPGQIGCERGVHFENVASHERAPSGAGPRRQMRRPASQARLCAAQAGPRPSTPRDCAHMILRAHMPPPPPRLCVPGGRITGNSSYTP